MTVGKSSAVSSVECADRLLSPRAFRLTSASSPLRLALLRRLRATHSATPINDNIRQTAPPIDAPMAIAVVSGKPSISEAGATALNDTVGSIPTPSPTHSESLMHAHLPPASRLRDGGPVGITFPGVLPVPLVVVVGAVVFEAVVVGSGREVVVSVGAGVVAAGVGAGDDELDGVGFGVVGGIGVVVIVGLGVGDGVTDGEIGVGDGAGGGDGGDMVGVGVGRGVGRGVTLVRAGVGELVGGGTGKSVALPGGTFVAAVAWAVVVVVVVPAVEVDDSVNLGVVVVDKTVLNVPRHVHPLVLRAAHSASDKSEQFTRAIRAASGRNFGNDCDNAMGHKKNDKIINTETIALVMVVVRSGRCQRTK